MFISDLLSVYAKSERVKQLHGALQHKGHAHLRNVVGSSIALIAQVAMSERKGFHIVVLPDKEEAAYFLNDLESACGKQPGSERNNDAAIDIFFFPRSARMAYEVEATDSMNSSEQWNVQAKRQNPYA